jgi:Na+/phosphate symporter
MKDTSIFVNPFRILSPKLDQEALRLEELHTRPVSDSVTLEEGLMIMISKLIEMARCISKAAVSESRSQTDLCVIMAGDVHQQEKILTAALVEGGIRKDLLKGLIRLPYRLERIGDMLESILNCCTIKSAKAIPFTDKAHAELEEIFDLFLDMLNNLRDALRTPNKIILEAVLSQGNRLSTLIEEAKLAHWERLEAGFCHVEASSLYRDILDSTKSAKDNVEKMCKSLLELGGDPRLAEDMATQFSQ